MRTNLVVIDDFYSNPDSIRKYALEQDYTISEDLQGVGEKRTIRRLPGKRSQPYLPDIVKQKISEILYPFAGKILKWHNQCGTFNICDAYDQSRIHVDRDSDNSKKIVWSGICFLTPNAPVESGTGIFRNKYSGERYCLESFHGPKAQHDFTQWEIIDRIGNIYNRMMLFRSDNYHSSLSYFGTNDDNSRLFQVFFMTMEK